MVLHNIRHILICLQDENVTACLPLDHTSADYDFNTNLYGFMKYFGSRRHCSTPLILFMRICGLKMVWNV